MSQTVEFAIVVICCATDRLIVKAGTYKAKDLASKVKVKDLGCKVKDLGCKAKDFLIVHQNVVKLE